MHKSFSSAALCRRLTARARLLPLVVLAASIFTSYAVPAAVNAATPPARVGLDSSFGQRGTLFFPQDRPLAPGSAAVAVDPIGGLVAAIPQRTFGHQDLVRVLSKGRLGSGFVAKARPSVQALAVDPQGRILASIGLEQELVVMRFLPDGKLDTGFGEGGTASVAVPGAVGRLEGSQATVLSVDDDGRVTVGRLKTARTSFRRGTGFVVARLTADGSLDRTFSEDGLFTVRIEQAAPYRLVGLYVEAATGKVTVLSTIFKQLQGAGSRERERFELVRFLSDGARDPSFAGSGSVRIAVGRLGINASAMAVDRRGRIVVGGTSGRGFGFARINANGRLDPRFGRRGRLIFPVPSPAAAALGGLATDQQGRVLVAVNAKARTFSPKGMTAFRLRSTGTLDRSFGEEGFCAASFPKWNTAATAILPQQGSAVLSGLASRPTPGYYPPTAPRLRALAIARCGTDPPAAAG